MVTDFGLGAEGEVPAKAGDATSDVAWSSRVHTSCMCSGSNCEWAEYTLTKVMQTRPQLFDRLASNGFLQDFNQFHGDRGQGAVARPDLLQFRLDWCSRVPAQENVKQAASLAQMNWLRVCRRCHQMRRVR